MLPPRVALISSSAGAHAGGAEAYTFGVARGLRQLGVEVGIFHAAGGGGCPCPELGAAHSTGPMVSRDSLPSRLLRTLGVYRITRTSPYDLEILSRRLLFGRGSMALKTYDLVEVQYPTEVLFFRLCGPRACRILHLHGPAVPPWLTGLCRRLNVRPNLTVTCSQWSADQLRARGFEFPIEVNHNGVDTTLFHPPESPDHSRAVGAAGVFHVGFVGRLIETKGLDVIAETASHFDNDMIFHVAGPREGDYKPPVRSNLRYLGSQSQPALAAILRSMDCFLFPSRRESFGIAVVEAMATGLPVIAAAVGGIPEIITHGEDGILIPSGDAGAAVRWIRTLCTDPSLRRRLGLRARETVLRRFTLKHTALRLLDLHSRWREAQAQRH